MRQEGFHSLFFDIVIDLEAKIQGTTLRRGESVKVDNKSPLVGEPVFTIEVKQRDDTYIGVTC